MSEVRTTEDITQDYLAMKDSINLINNIISGTEMVGKSAIDRQNTVDRNVEHLELMVAKDDWGSEDMTSSNSAITAGKAYTAS
tara:strand:+ start:291 stop:539 length:249 start_codon:yes stop_codon:yes gene_type:complete